MYILLVLVFAGGFVLFGVGSGSSGIGDILQNFFNTNSASGPSASALRDKTRDEPKNAQAWRDLATALQQDQKRAEAIVALKRFTALRPNNESGLQELAALYAARADDYRNDAAVAQADAQLVAPGGVFEPAATSPLGKAYQDPNGLRDPISASVVEQANAKASEAYGKLAQVSQNAVVVYKRLIKLDPTDATRQIQLGEAAQNAGDTATALAAYRKFIALAPEDPLVPAVRQQIKQLTAPSPAVTTG